VSDNVIQKDGYDPHIIPAETAARSEREGDDFKNAKPAGQETDDLDTTGGYTVDKEGLLNNYAVEPEMYYEVPGDRTAMIEAEEAERAEELAEAHHNDETGKLTEEGDARGKGPGLV